MASRSARSIWQQEVPELPSVGVERWQQLCSPASPAADPAAAWRQKHRPGAAFSIATAFLGAGQLIGPVLAGALADRFGTVAVPLFAGGIYTLGVLAATADEWMMARSA